MKVVQNSLHIFAIFIAFIWRWRMFFLSHAKIAQFLKCHLNHVYKRLFFRLQVLKTHLHLKNIKEEKWFIVSDMQNAKKSNSSYANSLFITSSFFNNLWLKVKSMITMNGKFKMRQNIRWKNHTLVDFNKPFQF